MIFHKVIMGDKLDPVVIGDSWMDFDCSGRTS